MTGPTGFAGEVRTQGRAAVIDLRPFGGTCTLRGCDPKKVLVGGARAANLACRVRDRGVEGDVRIVGRL